VTHEQIARRFVDAWVVGPGKLDVLARERAIVQAVKMLELAHDRGKLEGAEAMRRDPSGRTS
jgi:hypothetical protein